MQQVAFPMYVLPQLQADMCALWLLLVAELDMPDLPQIPQFDDLLAGGTVPQDLLMLQYCGFPYMNDWRGKLNPLACLHYDAPHCEGKMHRSVVVVHKDSPFTKLEDLRGKRVAINGYDSNTGMNLLRHLVAPLAQNGKFFGEVTVTGAHWESLRAVAEKRADVASIDCVTYAYIGDYLPNVAAQVRVIATTADSPALPIFTPMGVSEATREALFAAWQTVLAHPDNAALCKRLRMKAIAPVSEQEIAVIAGYAEQAAAAGYPELA